MEQKQVVAKKPIISSFWGTFIVFFGVAYLIGAGFVFVGIATGQEVLYYIAKAYFTYCFCFYCSI